MCVSHENLGFIVFNEDYVYQKLMAEAIQSKNLAIKKFQLFIKLPTDDAMAPDQLHNPHPDSLHASLLQLPLPQIGQPGIEHEFLNGVKDFPWGAMELGEAQADMVMWRPQLQNLTMHQEMKLMSALASNDNLRTVKFQGNHEVALLKGCGTEELVLDSNPAVSAAPRALGLVLGACWGLQSLSLRNMNITFTDWFDLMDGIKYSTSLSRLNDWNGYLEFLQGPLDCVDLSTLWNDVLMAYDLLCPVVHLLAINNCHRLTIRGVELGRALISDECLDNSTSLANQVSAALSKLPKLTWLDLSNNGLEDSGIQSLCHSLSGLTALAFLDLRDNCVSSNGWTSLAESVSGLSVLNEVNGWTGYEGLRCGSLMELTAVNVEGGWAMVSVLVGRSTSGLATLVLRNTAIGDVALSYLCPSLGNLTALVDLDLSVNYVGDDGATALSAALSGLVHLTRLDLRDNEVGNEGAGHLCSALSRLTALTCVDFRCVLSPVCTLLRFETN
mmetsp:Transcript_58759/g.155460  ORF Transcript_58759/g.155460 Transcript_58759/m.155460 type:complete len:500 (-) Transcript_58759:3283-4782(-)